MYSTGQIVYPGPTLALAVDLWEIFRYIWQLEYLLVFNLKDPEYFRTGLDTISLVLGLLLLS